MKIVTEKIITLLKTAEELYHQMVLLVGPSGSGKTTALHHLCAELNCDLLNVNVELSKRLIDMTGRQRMLSLSQLFEDLVNSVENIVVLDNLELLFDAALKQDPLRLLQQIARTQTIVAAWPGRMEGHKLIYAEPGHPEYREYQAQDILIVRIGEAEKT
jgi:Cdc6-like AAA superfamily ATPase